MALTTKSKNQAPANQFHFEVNDKSVSIVFYLAEMKCTGLLLMFILLAFDEAREIHINDSEQEDENITFVPIQSESNSVKFARSLLEITSKFFGKMNGSFEAANSLMKDVEEILDLTINYFTKESDIVAASLADDKKTLLQGSIAAVSNRIKASLNTMNTEHKITNLLKKKGLLEMPKVKVFNENVVQIDDTFQTVKSEATVLPIAHQIKTFLETPNLLNAILENQEQLQSCIDGKIHHFLNGKVWQEIKTKFNNKDVIPIFVYNDDFSPDDGLGPHGRSNKISAYYIR